MTNNEYSSEIFDAYAYAEKIFYIPLNGLSGEFQEFLEDLDDNEVKKLFPEMDIKEWNEVISDGENLPTLLQTYGYEGWIIEISVPSKDNFTFNEDGVTPKSYSVHYNIYRTEFIYCETFEEVLPKVKEVGQMVLQEYITSFKARNEKNSQKNEA
ncbi:hypothetical protein [Flavobacterium beibuense]|uniref:hypothetical protein n=1 Tax=Flavobacterium beibuense TaxID=657326 RepID=UPI003A9402E4